MIFHFRRALFRISAFGVALVTLTACPAAQFATDLTKGQVCDRMPQYQASNSTLEINVQPQQTTFVPLEGPRGLVNDPLVDTKLPKTIDFFKLAGIGGTRLTLPPRPPFFVKELNSNGLEVGVGLFDPPTGKVETADLSFEVIDKCNRASTINVRLISDPSTRPATQEELQAQLRNTPQQPNQPTAVAVARTESKPETPNNAVETATAPAFGHVEVAQDDSSPKR